MQVILERSLPYRSDETRNPAPLQALKRTVAAAYGRPIDEPLPERLRILLAELDKRKDA